MEESGIYYSKVHNQFCKDLVTDYPGSKNMLNKEDIGKSPGLSFIYPRKYIMNFTNTSLFKPRDQLFL